jgi:hypothetical protein
LDPRPEFRNWIGGNDVIGNAINAVAARRLPTINTSTFSWIGR